MIKKCALILITLSCLAPLAWTQEPLPPLPLKDGECLIPAQEWPLNPGPRSVKVYIHYPGGQLDQVSPETGIMLSAHNWGGTHARGTADPKAVVDRYNVVVVCVDYLQSGPGKASDPPYDFGYLQALDALRAIYYVYQGLQQQGVAFDSGRIYAVGGSGGGNITLMVNKFAPRSFACAIDMSGMARLTDAIAFAPPGGKGLSARYSQDPNDPYFLSKDAQAIRWPGHPDHLKKMKALGNSCKMIVSHGMKDHACPPEDAQEMARNMQAAGLDIEAHFITPKDYDGVAIKNDGHSVGDRTKIVWKFGDPYFKTDSPTMMRRNTPNDFDLNDEAVVYQTPKGKWIISYKQGYPIGRFEATKAP